MWLWLIVIFWHFSFSLDKLRLSLYPLFLRSVLLSMARSVDVAIDSDYMCGTLGDLPSFGSPEDLKPYHRVSWSSILRSKRHARGTCANLLRMTISLVWERCVFLFILQQNHHCCPADNRHTHSIIQHRGRDEQHHQHHQFHNTCSDSPSPSP